MMSNRRSAALLAVAATFIVLGCDQLNKPIRPLRNHPPRQSTQDPAPPDGGEAGAPAPAITAEPGDVHL